GPRRVAEVPPQVRPPPCPVPRPPPRPRHPDAPAGGPPQGGVGATGSRLGGDHPGHLLPRPSVHAVRRRAGLRPVVSLVCLNSSIPLPVMRDAAGPFGQSRPW